MKATQLATLKNLTTSMKALAADMNETLSPNNKGQEERIHERARRSGKTKAQATQEIVSDAQTHAEAALNRLSILFELPGAEIIASLVALAERTVVDTLVKSDIAPEDYYETLISTRTLSKPLARKLRKLIKVPA
jgi:hypothetical protein